MTKRITLALSFLLLGLLACMQSAPSSLTHLPTKAPLSAEPGSMPGTDCTVNTHALNVRECESSHCSVIGWLEYGWIVKAEAGAPGSAWIKITRGNLSGFARADYLTCNTGE